MKSKIFILIGKDRVQSFDLENGKVYSIGRSPMNFIHIKDVHISRYHLRVRFKDGRYYIKDLDTKNGTYVLGEKIESGIEAEVEEGVPVVIGMTVIGFGEQFELGCLPFLLSTGICGEVDENGELLKPFRTKTVSNNLGCIYRVNKALLKSKDKDEIITILLDNIFNLLKRIDRCAVVLYDDTKGEISKVEYRSKKPDDRLEKSYNKDLVMKSLIFNEAIMVRDTYDQDYDDEELTKSLRIMKIGSAACVPISNYFHTIGALYVDAIERPYAFRKNDLALLKDIVNRAALAIDEKELYH